ncbi:HAD-IA family hydrolase [Oricola sp.]|uniref:HAD-IA family hydrolase n=1 Tax=Oricola sp. TaxID=1979950 RepID=UPI0025CE5D48|nr:HAD-IA family hydrolase [Oricola sp.]MCI5073894.1 HAD-IA family hydrolase [Oricola sp.]
MAVRALILDVDGTLAETEELHRIAFNRTFEEAGLDWVWDRELYRELLAVTGGRERIRFHAERIGAQDIDVGALHRRKTDIYGASMRPGNVTLRPGVEALLRRARAAGLDLAIGTTTSRTNVGALMQATLGADALSWFRSVRTGEDTPRKKPDPEVYRLVLADLGFPPEDCLVFEDSANGLRAAKAAGAPTVITPSIYTAEDDFAGADYIFKNLDEPFSMLTFAPGFAFHDVPPDVRDLLFHGQ